MGSQASDTDSSIWADPDDLRAAFTLALSQMYKAEVPLYGDLVKVVSEVNHTSTITNPAVRAMRYGGADTAGTGPSRLDVERHGAIRVGTAQELRIMRSIFGVLGLRSVGYYDLSEAGLPMHATCFRPISQESLDKNPFRVFTSVLRPELLKNAEVRELAERILGQRNIFSDELIRILATVKDQGGRLTVVQGDDFIREALKTFKWQGSAIAGREEYEKLKAEHPVLADVVCFGTTHINHLTPRTLDIVKVQETMGLHGIQAKHRIEGPPARDCPILLRQTSFLAVEEAIAFPTCSDQEQRGGVEKSSHRARFGEVEERGAAVTPAGRALYDRLTQKSMERAMRESGGDQNSSDAYEKTLQDTFREFPDAWNELRRLGLVHFYYRCPQDQKLPSISKIRREDGAAALDHLLEQGFIEAVPVTYEDFLPLSAAGIFQSNLSSGASKSTVVFQANPDKQGLEDALGTQILDPDELYSKAAESSISKCSSQLQVAIVS